MELQEEARIAREIAEREDQAEMEAQVAMARRLQEEWNASEASQIAKQQRLAQEIAEREDRLELERLQAEWDRQEIAQTTNHSVRASSAYLDVGASQDDRPPPETSQTKRQGKVGVPRPGKLPSNAQPQVSTNASSNQDAKELSTFIAERRARHGQWEAEVQKANQTANEAVKAIRRRAREEEEETRRLEQQQRSLAKKARKEEEARIAAIEAERRARQAECTVCAEMVEKSDMVTLQCTHHYCGDCIARKWPFPIHDTLHC